MSQIDKTAQGQIHMFGVASFLFLPLAIVAHKGIVILFSLMSLSALASKLTTISGLRSMLPVLSSMAGLASVAWLSSIWSSTPGRSLQTSLVLTLFIVFGGLMFSFIHKSGGAVRSSCQTGLFAGSIFGILILGLEIFTDAWIHDQVYLLKGHPQVQLDYQGHVLKPALSILSILIWPVSVIALDKYGPTCGLIVFAFAAIIVFTGTSTAAQIGLLSGAIMYLFIRLTGKRGITAVAFVLVTVVCLTPFVPGQLPSPIDKVTDDRLIYLSHSAQHRIVIWKVSEKLIRQAPLIGYGMDTSRSFYKDSEKKEYIYLPDKPSHRWKNNSQPIPLHPHNMIIQLWLELGAFGAFALILVLVTVTRMIRDHIVYANDKAAAVACLISALIVASLGFGIWQNWWLASLILSAMYGILAFGKPKQEAQE